MATKNPSASRIPHKPEDSLGFRLGTLSNLVALPFATHGKDEDLTLLEWRMLQVLDAHPGISITEVCFYTGMHKMQASRALQRAVRMKRAVWKADATDGRRKLVFLTAAGKALCQRLYPGTAAREAELRKALSEEQRRVLGPLLDQLIGHFRA